MKILIPVLSGSELRQFYHSGIVNNLITSGNSVYSTVKANDNYLTDQILNTDSRIKILPFRKFLGKPDVLSYIRLILDQSFDKEFKRWSYTTSKQKNRIKQLIINFFVFLMNIKILKGWCEKLENRLVKKSDVSELKKVLNEEKIDVIILNSTRFLNYPELLTAALQLNIPVKVIYHTNKDIIAQGRISYEFKSYGVWNEEMKIQFIERYPHLESNIKIVGITHYIYLQSEDFQITCKNFLDLFEIKQGNCFIILYTAAWNIIKNEFFIVDHISKILKEFNIEYKVIVRKNPMDITNNWENHFKNRNDIIIQQPKWVMNEIVGLNYTLIDDLKEYSSLLTYADICINIPSTVTVEAAIKKLPVINICFEFPGVENTTNSGKLIDFWEAPFYKPYHKFDFVQPAFNIDHLKCLIKEFTLSKDKSNFKDYSACVSKFLSYDLESIRQKTLSFICD